MLNGDNDSSYPVVVQKRLFTLLGTPVEDKRHVLYQGGHGVFGVRRSEMIREMLEWLDRYLGPSRSIDRAWLDQPATPDTPAKCFDEAC